jgi:hypothetical protein
MAEQLRGHRQRKRRITHRVDHSHSKGTFCGVAGPMDWIRASLVRIPLIVIT